MSTAARAGRAAEEAAARYLAARGWRILARNIRRRVGEVDLLALDPAGVLVFVEVRARRRGGGESGRSRAASSVDRRKQERLVRAARAILAAQPRLQGLPARFDVVAVEADETGRPGALCHVPGAFELG